MWFMIMLRSTATRGMVKMALPPLSSDQGHQRLVAGGGDGGAGLGNVFVEKGQNLGARLEFAAAARGGRPAG